MNTPVTAHPEPQETPVLPDDRVGKYRLVRKLGEGGMGSVYEACHAEIGQRAAVKLLRAELSSEAKHVGRFFDEAKILSLVNHPGLIKIYDFDRTADGRVYIVMELLEGETLHSRLESQRAQAGQGGLPLSQVTRFLRQIASTLAAVHARGITHRDLKPENIFIVKDPEAVGGERAKILDFGIARFHENGGADEPRRTTVGVSMGTPLYMSPEQCEANPLITDRADIYALGIMAFELATGMPPFLSDSMAAMLRMHLVRPPPPLPESIPSWLAALIHRMLAKEPAQRPSAPEVAGELEQFGATRALPVAVASLAAAGQPARRRTVLIGGLLVLALLAVAGVFALRRTGGPPPTPVPGKQGPTVENLGKPPQTPPVLPAIVDKGAAELGSKPTVPADPAKPPGTTSEDVKSVKKGSDKAAKGKGKGKGFKTKTTLTPSESPEPR